MIESTKREVRITVTVDIPLMKELDKLAWDAHMTRSTFVWELLSRDVGKGHARAVVNELIKKNA